MGENNLTLPAILESASSKNSTRIVFTFPDKTYITFAVFYNRVELLSEFLLRNGIGKGDCVAIFDDHFINLPIIYFALARIGAITIPLLPSISPEELEFLMKQNQVVAVFARPSQSALFKSVRFPQLKFFINILSFRFEALQEDSVSQKVEKQIDKIKKAALELVKPEELTPPPQISADDEIQRLLLPDLNGEWQTYRYSHRHLISSAKMLTDTLALNSQSKLLFLLPFYFNLTISLGVLGPSLKNYHVIFARLPETLEELQALLDEVQPTQVIIEVGLLEKLLTEYLRPIPPNPLLQKSAKIFSFLRKKILGSRVKFLQQREWLICTNFLPASLALQQFLKEESIKATFLFGVYETTSALITGKPDAHPNWIEGQVIGGIETKIEPTDGQVGKLWVKGPNVVTTEKTKIHDGFVELPVMGEQSETVLKISGFRSTLLKPGPHKLIDARVIEVNLRLLPEIEDALIFQQNQEIILRVLPAPEFLLTHQQEMETRLAARIHAFLSEQFPISVPISRIHIETHPFPKTLLGQTLRYLPSTK